MICSHLAFYFKNYSPFDLINSEESWLLDFWDCQYSNQMSYHHILNLPKKSSSVQGIIKPVLLIGFSTSHGTANNQPVFHFHTPYCPRKGVSIPHVSYPIIRQIPSLLQLFGLRWLCISHLDLAQMLYFYCMRWLIMWFLSVCLIEAEVREWWLLSALLLKSCFW